MTLQRGAKRCVALRAGQRGRQAGERARPWCGLHFRRLWQQIGLLPGRFAERITSRRHAEHRAVDLDPRGRPHVTDAGLA